MFKKYFFPIVALALTAGYVKSDESQNRLCRCEQPSMELASLFKDESWKNFCQSLTKEEQTELKQITENATSSLGKLSDELDSLGKKHKTLMDNYKKRNGISTCCVTLSLNLVSCKENSTEQTKKSALTETNEQKPEQTNTLNAEEKAEFEQLQSEILDLGKKVSVQVMQAFDANPALKTKLTDYCKSSKNSLIVTVSCDHPNFSELIKIA